MRISYKNINLIVLLLLFVIFVYTPQFIVFGVVINTLYVFPLISIYVLIKNNYKLEFPSWLLAILFIQFLFFIIMSLYNGYLETFFLKEIFIFPFVFITCQFLYGRIKKLNYSNHDLVKFIMIALFINFLIIIVFSVFREFNTYLHSFINITPKQFKYIYETPWIRHSGISVSGFSNLSFKSATLYCIVFAYFIKNKTISINFIFLSLTLIIANIFVARTGLLMIIFLFMIYMFLKFKDLFKVFLVFTIIGFFSFPFFLNFEEDFILLDSFYRTFDILFLDNFMDDQTIKTLVYESEENQIKNIFLGDGDFGRTRGLISDIGYISFLKGGGLIGLIILTLHYWIPFTIFFKNYKSWKFLALWLVLFSMFLFNFKDLAFLSHGYIQALVLVIILNSEK